MKPAQNIINQHGGEKTLTPDQIDQSLRANIIGLRHNLLMMIDLYSGLVDELHSSGVLDYKEMQKIMHTRGIFYKIGKLLDYIYEMSHEQQEQFLLVLEEAGQKHVALYIRANGQINNAPGGNGCWPVLHSGTNELEVLRHNWKKVVELVDSENGLQDELLAIGCINRRHQMYIESETSDYAKRNFRLLSIIRQRSVDDYYKFIQCLSNTEQHHVAYILAPEKTSTKAETLNETLCRRLDVCHPKLIEDIDPDNGLLVDMFSAMCITRRQYENIKAAYSPSERNKRLLVIIQRGSQENFEKFMDCLSRTGQHHVCQLLLKIEQASSEMTSPVSIGLDSHQRVVGYLLAATSFSTLSTTTGQENDYQGNNNQLNAASCVMPPDKMSLYYRMRSVFFCCSYSCGISSVRIEPSDCATNSVALEQNDIDSEDRTRSKQLKRLDEERRRFEEERKLAEERRLEEEQRLAEERRIAEEQRKLAEERRLEEEQRLAEERRIAEEQRKLAEERRLEEEQRKLAEDRRLEEEQQKLAKERRIAEEQRNLAREERRLLEEQRLVDEPRIIEMERVSVKEERLFMKQIPIKKEEEERPMKEIPTKEERIETKSTKTYCIARRIPVEPAEEERRHSGKSVRFEDERILHQKEKHREERDFSAEEYDDYYRICIGSI